MNVDAGEWDDDGDVDYDDSACLGIAYQDGLAGQLARVLIADMYGREGGDYFFLECDRERRQEIADTWTRIIAAHGVV